ncbi:MAG: sugar nucleotide-binding protein [bacterium]|nr:sugar nucleotide-binding protein [bacterium]
MAKVLIFGAGYLGNQFHERLLGSVLSSVDIVDRDAVLTEIERVKPDAVLNTAGKTGRPNVDWCEDHPHETFRSNTIGALVLAEVCAHAGIHLTHLASGCIFYGPSPDPVGWREDDFANPSATYSRSKYATDLALSLFPNVAIARLRMPIDSKPGQRNLITKLSHYPKVIDVENSVTVVDDLVDAIRQIIEKRATGIFHVVNEGTMKHRDLMALYTEIVDPAHTCEWIENDELVGQGLATRGRSNCILQNTRLKEIGIEMRPIDVALRDCMVQYADYLNNEKNNLET